MGLWLPKLIAHLQRGEHDEAYSNFWSALGPPFLKIMGLYVAHSRELASFVVAVLQRDLDFEKPQLRSRRP